MTLAMARIRDRYWTSTLRQLVKRIIKRCCGCKRFSIIHYRKSSQGLIPTHRTKQDLPFSVIGRDYAGPFICKKKREREISNFIYCCSPVTIPEQFIYPCSSEAIPEQYI